MQDKIIKIPATLTKYESMANGAMKVHFHTQEGLGNEMKNIITAHHEKYGHLLFLHEESIEDEIMEIVKDLPKLITEKEEKTPSQRLRDVLFVYWSQNKSKDDTDFNSYYRKYLDKITEGVKSKLV